MRLRSKTWHKRPYRAAQPEKPRQQEASRFDRGGVPADGLARSPPARTQLAPTEERRTEDQETQNQYFSARYALDVTDVVQLPGAHFQPQAIFLERSIVAANSFAVRLVDKPICP